MIKFNLTSLVASLAIVSSLTLTGCGGGGGDTNSNATANTEDTDTSTDDTNLSEFEITLTAAEMIHTSDEDEYKDKIIDPYPYVPEITQVAIDAYLQAVNEQRVKGADCHTRGVFPAVKPLIWNAKLYSAAQEHNYDMINAKEVVGVDENLGDNGYIGHGGSGTDTDWTATQWNLNARSSYTQRAYNNGYDSFVVLENVAIYSKNFVSDQPSEIEKARQAVKMWMESDGHCATIMYSPTDSFPQIEENIQGEMGMGYTKNPNDSYVWGYVIGFR